MRFKVLVFFSLIIFGLSLNAKPTVYGTLWVTLESEDGVSGSEINLASNSSRLGLKDSVDFGDTLKFVYQVEYEIDPIDGKADESKGRVLKQRNTFVGFKGTYGTLFLGKHDTAFKRSPSKIDLFNDLAGDIENILHGDNRMEDFIGYTTPLFNENLSATFNAMRGGEMSSGRDIGDSMSFSLNYKTTLLYAAVSVDSDVKGYDSNRVSVNFPLNKTKLGIIYQNSKNLMTGIKEDGYVLSLSIQAGNKGIFKTQIAKSDMKIDSGKQTSFSYEYKINKELKLFFMFSNLTGDDLLNDKEVGAVGFKYKF
jgi:predicted porin